MRTDHQMYGMDMGTLCGGWGTDHRVHVKTERASCVVRVHHYMHACVIVDVDAYIFMCGCG